MSACTLVTWFVVVESNLHDSFQDNFETEAEYGHFDQEEIQLLQPWITDELKRLEKECDSAVQAKDDLFKGSYPNSAKEASEKLTVLHLRSVEISEKCGEYEKASRAARHFNFDDVSSIPPNWIGEWRIS